MRVTSVDTEVRCHPEEILAFILPARYMVMPGPLTLVTESDQLHSRQCAVSSIRTRPGKRSLRSLRPGNPLPASFPCLPGETTFIPLLVNPPAEQRKWPRNDWAWAALQTVGRPPTHRVAALSVPWAGSGDNVEGTGCF